MQNEACLDINIVYVKWKCNIACSLHCCMCSVVGSEGEKERATLLIPKMKFNDKTVAADYNF